MNKRVLLDPLAFPMVQAPTVESTTSRAVGEEHLVATHLRARISLAVETTGLEAIS